MLLFHRRRDERHDDATRKVLSEKGGKLILVFLDRINLVETKSFCTRGVVVVHWKALKTGREVEHRHMVVVEGKFCTKSKKNVRARGGNCD